MAPSSHPAPSRRSAAARRGPWIVLALVVVAALAFGSGAGRGRTLDDRVQAVARTIKCPQCSDQSAATSEAPTAVAIRADIARRLARGQTGDEIRDYYGSRYEESILLNPSSSGTASLVWILPVVALVGAFGGLAFAFRRWKAASTGEVSDDDRQLVADAQRGVFPAGAPDDDRDGDGPDDDGELVGDSHGEGAGR